MRLVYGNLQVLDPIVMLFTGGQHKKSTWSNPYDWSNPYEYLTYRALHWLPKAPYTHTRTLSHTHTCMCVRERECVRVCVCVCVCVCVWCVCVCVCVCVCGVCVCVFCDVNRSPNGADGVINIFSLSKSYGLAGWRVGYMAYPPSLHEVSVHTQYIHAHIYVRCVYIRVQKAQDTLVTNCPINPSTPLNPKPEFVLNPD